MKFKYYMRGFGTGLIAATIILMIAGKTGNNNLHAADSRETETAGSVIAFTTQSPSETAITTEAAAETVKAEEALKAAEAVTTVESTKVIESTKAAEGTKAVESTKVVEGTTGNSEVSAAAGGEDGEFEVVFSEVHTASQAVDILYDAGIIADKEEFSSYMEESGYDRKIRDGIYQLKPGDSYEAIAQTITQTN